MHVVCSKEQLDRRIVADSRRRFRKLNDTAALQNLLDNYELFAAIPFVNNFSLDNSDMPPNKAAQLIATHYNLPRATRET